MKTTNSLLCLAIVLGICISACKKDKDETEEGPVVPSWLIPYQGTYRGTFEGDDHGTWKFVVSNSNGLTIETNSTTNSETMIYNGQVNPDGTFVFTGTEISIAGDVKEYCEVTGTWQNTVYALHGTFKGWKDPTSKNSLIKQIEDEENHWKVSYKYDDQGRHITTQDFVYGMPGNFEIRAWHEEECTFTSFNSDCSVFFEYIYPYPFNSQGLAEYATYIIYTDAETEYDTIYYKYSGDGYMLREDRLITIVPLNGDTVEKGTETITYSYENNNLVLQESSCTIGNMNHVTTNEFTYYPAFPNLQTNHAPFLGKLSQNLCKTQTTDYHQGGDIHITELYYEFYDVDLVKLAYGQTTFQGYVHEFKRAHYYK